MDLEAQEKTKEPAINNCITFNGIIKTEPVMVADDYYAITVAGGLKEEQLPPIIIKSSKDSLSFFTVGKKIAGFGSLSKEGNDWVIWCIQTTELN